MADLYTIPDDVLAARLEGEAVLLHMETKRYHRLNETAAVVWKGLERGDSREAIVQSLLEGFETDAETAAAEVDRLLSDLEERGLIQREG